MNCANLFSKMAVIINYIDKEEILERTLTKNWEFLALPVVVHKIISTN